MNEILQKLLEAEILTEDTKKELEEAINTQLEEAITSAKDEASADVRAELTEQWVKERDSLVEAVDTKVNQFLETEMNELKEDINRFRDLETEYAEKVVENKAALRSELKEDMKQLVEKIESFLEIRLAAEMEELKEDIEDARKNEFGRSVMEAFEKEYRTGFLGDDDSVYGQLQEASKRLEDTQSALVEAEKRGNALERTAKMDKILSPLDGKQRDVMEAILRSVATDQLEEGYNTFIGRVIRETAEEDTSEKENKVLAEGASSEDEGNKDKLEEATLISGDNVEQIEENKKEDEKKQKLSESARQRLRKLGGVS